MPVTLRVFSHDSKPLWNQNFADDAGEILHQACPDLWKQPLKVLQSSLTKDTTQHKVRGHSNGFISSVVEAYSSHHHLIIRPEDIWLAVLTQFSFYVNAQAEELHDHFVAHSGQKKLRIQYGGSSRHCFDFGVFAHDMGNRIQENVKDPDLREWIIPNFTTTTRDDEVVASIIMMGTVQKYFSFECSICCGIPTVTLLGEKVDYERILERLDTLSKYGREPTQFACLLQPVVQRMIDSFEDPTGVATCTFWQQVLDVDRGSGFTTYTGWLTAFCYWNEDGKCLYDVTRGAQDEHLRLDGIVYHQLDEDDVPPGWIQVPVEINDNGEIVESIMVAGSVGSLCTSSAESALIDFENLPARAAVAPKRPQHGLYWDDDEVDLRDELLPQPEPEIVQKQPIIDTMQPQSGWWILEKLQTE